MSTPPYLAFDEKWFSDNQQWLLYCLNAWPTKFLLRKILCIDSDIKGSDRITCIAPNRFEMQPEPGLVWARFRTHWKYSKRVYHAFKPVWWAFHLWDQLVADRFIPQLSYGFETLTAYPQPGTGTAPVDGYVYYYTSAGATWSTLHNSAYGSTANSTDNEAYCCGIMNALSGTGGFWEQIRRGFFGFDTSSIVSGSVITSETVSLYITAKANAINETSMHIVYANPSGTTALVVGDYDMYGSGLSYGSISYASLTTSSYNTWTCSSTGTSRVVMQGYTWVASMLGYDYSNTEPATVGSCVITSRFADRSGTSNDPYLTIVYRPGGMIYAGPTAQCYHGTGSQE